MKNIVALVVLFGTICNLNEACSGWTRRTQGRGRNPKIIRTLPPVTEAAEQATEKPTQMATEAITTTPPVATEGVVELTTEAAGGEVNTEKPTEKATENPVVQITEETAQETTKAPTEAAIPTEPKAVEANTELIDPLTRPTSVHRFFKQSAFVGSTTDDRNCSDVDGQCKKECDVETTEYVKGVFQCPFLTPQCCGQR